jgi:cell division protein FtsQ
VKPVPSNRKRAKDAPLPDVLDVGADEAPMPPPGPTKEKAARASRVMNVLRTIAGVLLVLGVSGSVAWGARKYVKTSPRFAVSEIVVSGGRFRSVDQITDTAGVRRGANVFGLDLEASRQRLLQDPWIYEAELARRLPGTIYVQVKEREAAAIAALGESYLVARDGEIFKRLESGDPVDLPIVTGLTSEGLAEDREGVKHTLRRAIDLAEDYDRGALGAKAQLQEIHLSPDGAVTLIVGKNGLQLSLGEPPYRKKIDQAARIVAELERRGSKADAILLDNEARPERVVVRMR